MRPKAPPYSIIAQSSALIHVQKVIFLKTREFVLQINTFDLFGKWNTLKPEYDATQI